MPVPSAPATPSPADAVAAAVLGVPGVVRLDGGPFGTVASHLPGRRVVGVRVPEGAGAVEVAVVVGYGAVLPALAERIAAAVRGVLGAVEVDVTFADVVDGPA